MKLIDFSETYKDLDTLYTWADQASQVSCVSDCNKCCTNDVIWMTLPELIRMYRNFTPFEYTSGCPYRTEKGCGVYDIRPLTCRTFGHMPKNINKRAILPNMNISLGEWDFSLFGPGVCEYSLRSHINLKEIRKIYSCYVALSKYGMVAIGSSREARFQEYVLNISKWFQALPTTQYQVYCKNGIPRVFK